MRKQEKQVLFWLIPPLRSSAVHSPWKKTVRNGGNADPLSVGSWAGGDQGKGIAAASAVASEASRNRSAIDPRARTRARARPIRRAVVASHVGRYHRAGAARRRRR